jgi:uncharacterized damage-inducible protein DinB
VTAFSDLPELILGPLAGRDDDAWFRAPAGVWSAGQVVDHVTIAIENSAEAFTLRADKPPMRRRSRPVIQALASHLLLTTGWFPRGRRAPERTLPAPRPERAATEARLRAGVAAFLDLERRLLPQRAYDLFVKHPALGDLTLGEFMTFHVRHGAHHRKQIVRRIRSA